MNLDVLFFLPIRRFVRFVPYSIRFFCVPVNSRPIQSISLLVDPVFCCINGHLTQLSFTGFYWVLLGFTGFYWVLLGFTGFYWFLLVFTGFYRVLLSIQGQSKVFRYYLILFFCWINGHLTQC